jgi:folate-binding protein YgfZ
MNSEWQTFLGEAGARLEDSRVLDFGDPAAETQAALNSDVLADLSHFALVEVTGEDASDFLQGQFSNDVRLVTGNHSQLSAHCTPKGRVLVNFRLFRREGAYYLRMASGLVEAAVKRLRMYVLRSKVVVEDKSDALVRFGLSGPNAPALLGAALAKIPGEVDAAVTTDGVTVVRIPGSHPRYELYGEPVRLQALWKQLSEKARPVGEDGWQLLDIHAGVPTVFPETSEAFVPQMINLHAIDGVSFRKGCYPGQEVVARMQYLGKLKRRMYRAHIDAGQRPVAGGELFSERSASGQGAGKIVDARPAPEGGYDLLVVTQISEVEAGHALQVGDASGPALRFEALPYDVPVGKEE